MLRVRSRVFSTDQLRDHGYVCRPFRTDVLCFVSLRVCKKVRKPRKAAKAQRVAKGWDDARRDEIGCLVSCVLCLCVLGSESGNGANPLKAQRVAKGWM